MFQIKRKQTFPQREEEILSFWQDQEIFNLSLTNREGRPLFSFFDGPPFATGLPHYGHLLAGTIKDTVLRYKTMQGFYVPRRFGWDCHGLPVENEIEKAKELSGTRRSSRLGSAPLTKSAARSSSAIRRSGSRRSTGWGAGSTLKTPTTRWTAPLWSRFGGFLQRYTKRD